MTKYAKHPDRSEVRIILLLGAPGSGKGTQSSLLTSRFGIPSVSTGAMLREEAARTTPAGRRLRKTMAAGALVDDETVCNAVASKIKELCTPHKPGESLILDGFPRTVAQARNLDWLLESLGMPGPLVLHLDVPSDVLLRRLASRRQCAKCGAVYSLSSSSLVAGASRCHLDGGVLVERDDDREGVIARRLAAYQAETLPVVDHYRGQDYRRIDGDRGPADIAKEVREIVAFFTAIAVAA